MEIRIGTSGYFYMHWKSKFYPDDLDTKDYLRYYSSFFNTVEMNSSFYHIPQENSIRNWARNVPPDFKFSVKVYRGATHFGNLKIDILEDFISKFNIIKDRIGFYLIQFPPSYKYSEKNFRDLISFESDNRIAIEFRNKTWINKEIMKKLNEHYFIVYSDYENISLPILPHDSIIYARFHGSTGKYKGEYGEKLREIIKKFFECGNIKELWIYFNNDYDAAAIRDAKYCKEIINDQLKREKEL